MKITHIFSDGTQRSDITGVKVPLTKETAGAYQAIATVAMAVIQKQKNEVEPRKGLS